MARQFQFRLKTLFRATAIVAVAAAILAFLYPPRERLLLIASLAQIGAWFGAWYLLWRLR
jgi:hypothetical protein